ncbi:hypothetical protein AK973_0233 [Pseudomonas brassicacearum]|nr:hypothetical protein AK973_0233 [Pseudomonas brassicacearum]
MLTDFASKLSHNPKFLSAAGFLGGGFVASLHCHLSVIQDR